MKLLTAFRNSFSDSDRGFGQRAVFVFHFLKVVKFRHKVVFDLPGTNVCHIMADRTLSQLFFGKH